MKTPLAQPDALKSPQIISAFERLVERQEAKASQIQTKEDQAQHKLDAQIVERASDYSVEGIVKGLAQLELSFSDQLQSLAQTLDQEASKLQELKRAIFVQRGYQQGLQDVKIAAEALNILEQQNREQLKNFETFSQQQRLELEESQREFNEDLAKQKQQLEQEQQEYIKQRDAKRTKEEDEFDYQKTTARQKAQDSFDHEKTAKLRDLEQGQRDHDEDWQRRQAALDKRAQDIEMMRQHLDELPSKIEEATKDARENAIKRERQNAKVEAELLQREMDNDVQVYELQMRTLQDKIEAQAQQLRDLISQLNAASNQTQNLATKAIEGAQHKQSA